MPKGGKFSIKKSYSVTPAMDSFIQKYKRVHGISESEAIRNYWRVLSGEEQNLNYTPAKFTPIVKKGK
jgi:hypothetical protein